jgi:adenylate cyclase
MKPEVSLKSSDTGAPMPANVRVLRSAGGDRLAEAAEPQCLPLNGFVLDLDRGELLTADRQLAGLRRQALEVLLLLGARVGQVVGKDELMRTIWPDVVVGESSLAKAISDIRHVLHDDDRRVLRNVARRGYMLVPDAAAPPASPASPARAVPSPPARAVPSLSLVVLPMKAERAADEWIAEAITADLTTGMDRMSGSVVIGHGTACTYKGRDLDPRVVARELAVRYVVIADMRNNGEHLRLSMALIDGESGRQLWSQQLDVPRAELVRSTDIVVGQLARSLFVQLFHAVGERVLHADPKRVTADELALRGWSVYFRVLSGENFRESVRLFEQALVKDPACVRALAGAATANSFGVVLGYLPDKAAALRRAEEAADRLEQLGVEDWFALTGRLALANAQHEWERMLRLANVMVERFPNDPTAHQQRGAALMKLGEFEESLAAAERAVRFSPRDSRYGLLHLCVATNQFILERYAQAAESARRMQALSPNIPLATPLLAASLVRIGCRAEGEALLREYLSESPHFDSSRLAALMPGSHPRFVDGRERLISSLGEIGLPDARR